MIALTRDERLRRTAILCCHFLRNLAFYRAGWRYDVDLRRRVARKTDQFWVNTNSNCLDIAILEWCKLFAREKDKHHWKSVVTDHGQFNGGLLQAVCLTEDQFKNYVDSMLRYRDKFVAHLDDERTMFPPRLRIARKCAAYLYDHLLNVEDQNNALLDAQRSALAFYGVFFRAGYRAYFENLQNTV